MIILGISIGTTRTGVCILQDEVLIDYNIHNFPSAWSDNKLRIIINCYKKYIQKYQVTAIMVKIPPLQKHSKAISLILKRIDMLAKEYECEFDLITKSEIKHRLSLRSTNEIIEGTKQLYPQLSSLYEKGCTNDQRYYKKLYEAVIGAYIYKEMQRARLL